MSRKCLFKIFQLFMNRKCLPEILFLTHGKASHCMKSIECIGIDKRMFSIWYSQLAFSYLCIHTHISPYLSSLDLRHSHPPYPTPLGSHKAPSWFPCAMLLFTPSYSSFGSVDISMPTSHFVSAYPSPSPCPQVHSLVGLCLYSPLVPRFFRTF